MLDFRHWYFDSIIFNSWDDITVFNHQVTMIVFFSFSLFFIFLIWWCNIWSRDRMWKYKKLKSDHNHHFCVQSVSFFWNITWWNNRSHLFFPTLNLEMILKWPVSEDNPAELDNVFSVFQYDRKQIEIIIQKEIDPKREFEVSYWNKISWNLCKWQSWNSYNNWYLIEIIDIRNQ